MNWVPEGEVRKYCSIGIIKLNGKWISKVKYHWGDCKWPACEHDHDGHLCPISEKPITAER